MENLVLESVVARFSFPDCALPNAGKARSLLSSVEGRSSTLVRRSRI